MSKTSSAKAQSERQRNLILMRYIYEFDIDKKRSPAFSFSIECFFNRSLTHYKKNQLKN